MMKRILISFFFALLIPFIAHAQGTVLRVVPSKTEVALGEQITVSVIAASPTQAMNAVSGTLIYPTNVSLVSISKQGTIINFWTQEAESKSGRIPFEGVIVSPGYQGTGANIFTAVFVAKQQGKATFSLTDGAILANDGRGTNILDSLGSGTIAVRQWNEAPIAYIDQSTSQPIATSLPVITRYSSDPDSANTVQIFGKGKPGARTEIVFSMTSLRSLGERFVSLVQSKRHRLDAVVVQNDPTTGAFQYQSPPNVIAGAYNATPYLVDDNTDSKKEGASVQLFVKDNKIVRILIVAINILALLVPIVGLIVLIYFIPWYSRRRMQLLKEKLALEEEKIKLDEHEIARKERHIDAKD